MLRDIALAVAGVFFLPGGASAQEQPPYAPSAPAGSMTSYNNAELGFSVQYPVEFTLQKPTDFLSVMRRGHVEARGTAPEKDPEHEQAEKCMHALAYATAGPLADPQREDDSPDAILIMDFDRSCVPKGLTGDPALTQITRSVLNVPGSTQMVPQMWFQGGNDRHIHSGMAGETMTVPGQGDNPPREITLAIAGASFAQKEHWILVAYINGTREGPVHKNFPLTSVTFGNDRPVLLFPFLLGSIDMKK